MGVLVHVWKDHLFKLGYQTILDQLVVNEIGDLYYSDLVFAALAYLPFLIKFWLVGVSCEHIYYDIYVLFLMLYDLLYIPPVPLIFCGFFYCPLDCAS